MFVQDAALTTCLLCRSYYLLPAYYPLALTWLFMNSSKMTQRNRLTTKRPPRNAMVTK